MYQHVSVYFEGEAPTVEILTRGDQSAFAVLRLGFGLSITSPGTTTAETQAWVTAIAEAAQRAARTLTQTPDAAGEEG